MASPETNKKKLIAGILAILLGWVGAHKFYLGYKKPGIILLCVYAAFCIFQFVR